MTRHLVRIAVVFLAVATAGASSIAIREHGVTWLAFAAFGFFCVAILAVPFVGAAQAVSRWRRRSSDKFEATIWMATAAAFCGLATVYLFVLLWKTAIAQLVAGALALMIAYLRWRRRTSGHARSVTLLGASFFVMTVVSLFCLAGFLQLSSKDVTPLGKVLFSADTLRAMTRTADGAPGRAGRFYDLKTDAAAHRLYFSDRVANRVGAIDLESGKVTLSPDLGRGPEQLVLVNERSELVTYLKGGFGTEATMVLDPTTLVPRRRCAIGDFVDLAASPAAGVLAGVKEYRPYFFRVEPDKCHEAATRIGTMAPYQVLCARRAPRCYVSGWITSRTLSAVDLAPDGSPTAWRGLALGAFSIGMALDEERGLLYVSRPFAGCVDVVDTGRWRRIGRIPAPTMVRAIAIAPELDIIFLPTYFEGVVEVRRLSTGQPLDRFRVGKFVREIIWDQDLRTLFIASADAICAIKADELSSRLHRPR